DERVARRELAAEALLPGVVADGPELRVPAAEEQAHRALGRLEAVLDVERRPRAALLVLGEGRAVRVGVALRAHVGLAGDRSALQVGRAHAVGAADRRVGVVVGPEGPDA